MAKVEKTRPTACQSKEDDYTRVMAQVGQGSSEFLFPRTTSEWILREIWRYGRAVGDASRLWKRLGWDGTLHGDRKWDVYDGDS